MSIFGTGSHLKSKGVRLGLAVVLVGDNPASRAPLQLKTQSHSLKRSSPIINKNEGCYWAICLKENPRPVGTICYFDFSSDQTTAEIRYELHPFYHIVETLGLFQQLGLVPPTQELVAGNRG